ncbi:MAG: tRNA (adenine(22)-N(1))-methyltransferase TrmK, partial [Acholeplasmatales bacterium]|nr:tRNA (adenine(22)-N(1))-methyltransferase TrmK [Acholeplasmatales bacterium]
ALYDSNKYYEIIVAIEGNEKLSNFEINYGPILLKKRPDDFIQFYTKKRDFIKSVIESLKNDEIKKEKELLLKDYIRIVGE